jgi:chemotaxis regulatin CheY-phosphate phosphatase CheZ
LSHTNPVPVEKLERLSELIKGLCESTQDATDTILHCCETITTDSLPETVAQIYKACAVQDLTNQRLKIIENILQEIESGIYGTEDTLLAGPQRAQHMLSQDDIDNLMNGSE